MPRGPSSRNRWATRYTWDPAHNPAEANRDGVVPCTSPMMILQRNRHTASPERALLMRRICRSRLLSRCQACTTWARTVMKSSFRSHAGDTTQVVGTLHSSNPPGIVKGHLEKAYENAEFEFFAIGRSGADGIDFGYRKGHKGLWAF